MSIKSAGSSRVFWRDYSESLQYIASTPLVLAIGLAGVGWATGGGAAQILFTLFGELVFDRGTAGVGLIWSAAGVGLVIGGLLGHRLGKLLSYQQYLHTVGIAFLIHGVAYILFAAGSLVNAIIWIVVSRAAIGTNNVMNRTILLNHVPDRLRGRVFTTIQAMSDAVLMFSLALASAATEIYSIRQIGIVAGVLSASTAVFWAWAVFAGKLPEPARESMVISEEELEPSDPVTPA